MTAVTIEAGDPPPRSSLGQVIFASLIGTTIEWYDFFLYGTAAALVFNKLFFPSSEPLVGTILAFATYALGFVARPLGGIVFGILYGIGFGLVWGISYPRTWTVSLTFVQLALRRHTPVRLLRFLDDARERNVLRTVGPVYQFRHARLQDRLARAVVPDEPHRPS